MSGLYFYLEGMHKHVGDCGGILWGVSVLVSRPKSEKLLKVGGITPHFANYTYVLVMMGRG